LDRANTGEIPVWAAVDLIEAAIYWAMAKYLAPDSIRLKNLFHWQKTAENPESGGFQPMPAFTLERRCAMGRCFPRLLFHRL
jgi:hypothetical protein